MKKDMAQDYLYDLNGNNKRSIRVEMDTYWSPEGAEPESENRIIIPRRERSRS